MLACEYFHMTPFQALEMSYPLLMRLLEEHNYLHTPYDKREDKKVKTLDDLKKYKGVEVEYE